LDDPIDIDFDKDHSLLDFDELLLVLYVLVVDLGTVPQHQEPGDQHYEDVKHGVGIRDKTQLNAYLPEESEENEDGIVEIAG
jgi:hypothetical protein